MTAPARGGGRKLVYGLLVLAAYVVAARLGFRFSFVAEQVTTVWAPSGIAQAALLLWGRSLWPAVWLGAFASNAMADAPIWTAVAIATGNTLEALLTASLLSRERGFEPAFRKVRDAVGFIAVGATLAPVVSASVGVWTLCAAGEQNWSQFATLWADWWLGDALGAIVVAPLLMTLVRRNTWRRAEVLTETGLLLLGAAIATEMVFGRLFGRQIGYHPLEYVIFPFITAAAVRLGQPATALVVLTATAVSMWNTLLGVGPFASDEVRHSLVLLQGFTGILAGTGLLLASAIDERKTSERRRTAAYAVVEVLARSPSLPEAAPRILQAVCEELEWPVGALWMVDTSSQTLGCLSTWDDRTPGTEAFSAANREWAFRRGEGLPGRVWDSNTALWVTDVLYDTNFPRAAAAARAGLHGAFAFPIALGGEPLGAIEFFKRSVVTADPDMLRTMSAVGTEIGQFVARKTIEAAALEAERERELLLQRELVARRDAESANRAKDEFLATVSHELRTPLNAILGWTRMLLDGTLSPGSARRALEVIDRNAQLQVQIVADILDASRIITGGLTLEVQTVDLAATVTAAIDAVRPAADAKPIAIQLQVAEAARTLRGDPQRLQQVVWNLLSNAVKFTPAGGLIQVSLSSGAGDRILVQVSDNGAGIDPAFLPHVFERFRQADGSASRQFGGLGLGLAIVRYLVELHGGQVRAESEGTGKGSTFTVELPRATPTAASATP